MVLHPCLPQLNLVCSLEGTLHPECQIFVPTPLEGGGTIYSNGFFLFRQFWPIDIFIVQSCEITSLKSPSSVEYGIKKIIWNFVFYRELSKLEFLWIIDEFPLFLFTFSRISSKISSILLKIVKIVNNSTVDFIFKDQKLFLTILNYFFGLKFWVNISKLNLSIKNCPK